MCITHAFFVCLAPPPAPPPPPPPLPPVLTARGLSIHSFPDHVRLGVARGRLPGGGALRVHPLAWWRFVVGARSVLKNRRRERGEFLLSPWVLFRERFTYYDMRPSQPACPSFWAARGNAGQRGRAESSQAYIVPRNVARSSPGVLLLL